MPYVASSEPARIQASVVGFHDPIRWSSEVGERRSRPRRATSRSTPLAAAGPARGDRAAVDRVAGARPAPPAVEARDREHDLAAGLPPQGSPPVCPLSSPLTNTVKSRTLPTRPTGQAQTRRRIPQQRAGEAEQVADDLADRQHRCRRRGWCRAGASRASAASPSTAVPPVEVPLASSRSTYLAITSTSRLTRSPGLLEAEGGAGQRLGDQADGERAGRGRRRRHDGQADAVDGDRALVDQVARQLGRAWRSRRPPSARSASGARRSRRRRRGPGRCARRAGWSAVTARSRLTRSPGATPSRLVLSSVSCMTSAVHVSLGRARRR